MAEVFGVVGVAAQLSSICFSLIERLKQIKGASSTLQKYHNQLQELSFISESISNNPLLQTPEINILTESLVSLIRQTCLTDILKRHRLVRGFFLVQNESDLAKTFQALERQKLSLCLSIEQVQAKTLHQIQVDVSAIALNKMPTHKATRCSEEQPNSPSSDSETPKSWPLDKEQPTRSTQLTQLVHRPDIAPNSPANRGNQGQNRASFQHQELEMNEGIYIHNYAGPGVDQANGLAFEGSAEMLVGLKDSSRYVGSVKEGHGEQLNGCSIEGYGNGPVDLDLAKFNGKHENPQVFDVENTDPSLGTKAVQRNGPHVKLVLYKDAEKFRKATSSK